MNVEWGFGRDSTDVNNRGQDVRSDQLAGSFGLDMDEAKPGLPCHDICDHENIKSGAMAQWTKSLLYKCED